MSDVYSLLLTVALLGANAFFVGAEFALISARRTMIEPRARSGSRAARITLGAMENVSLMMAGAQLGITICSLALGYISEPAIAHLLEIPFAALGIPAALLHPISFVIALSIVTYLHVVFGEMVPKNIALAGPERMAMILAPILVGVVTILRPVLWLLNGIANGILRLLRVQPKDEVTSVFTRDEVAALVAESHGGGQLEAHDERLLLDALSFEERSVTSVLLPMHSVTALPAGVTPAQAEQVAVEGYSRFPVFGETGDLDGYVHIKDLVELDPRVRNEPVDPGLIRSLPALAPELPLREALTRMQVSGAHLGAVRDELGRLKGIVTLEDMLEELVGQIRDDSRA